MHLFRGFGDNQIVQGRAEIVVREQHRDIENETRYVGYANSKETPWDEETWWWDDEVMDAVSANEDAKKED